MKFTNEHRRKISDSRRKLFVEGKIVHPRGFLGKKHSLETKLKCAVASLKSRGNRGKKASPEIRTKLSIARLGNKNALGIKHSEVTKAKMSRAHKLIGNRPPIIRMYGAENPAWKGGITSENSKIRHSPEYRVWRKQVFERDNWTCQFCGKRGVYLQADHIKPFAFFPELRFSLKNGRTLCEPCHRKTPTYLNRWYVKSKTLTQ